MPIETSAGAVIFREEGGKIFYLLLHYPTQAKRRVGDEGKLRKRQTSSTDSKKDYWDFPKGNIEKGEKLVETVKRETKEETGLGDIKFIPGFKEAIKYFYKLKEKNIFKIVTFFLVRTKIKEVKISWEHTGFQWLPYEEAMEQITFKNAKEILKKANDFISKKSI